EKWAAAIWSEVLKIEKIGPEDDFFELGGHSLLAVELMTRLEKEFNISLPLTSLFKHATLTDFATLLDGKFETERVAEGIDESAHKCQVPLIPSQKEIWLSCMIGGKDANLAYNQSFSLRLEGILDVSVFCRSVE